jgi:hypothetical protein
MEVGFDFGSLFALLATILLPCVVMLAFSPFLLYWSLDKTKSGDKGGQGAALWVVSTTFLCIWIGLTWFGSHMAPGGLHAPYLGYRFLQPGILIAVIGAPPLAAVLARACAGTLGLWAFAIAVGCLAYWFGLGTLSAEFNLLAVLAATFVGALAGGAGVYIRAHGVHADLRPGLVILWCAVAAGAAGFGLLAGWSALATMSSNQWALDLGERNFLETLAVLGVVAVFWLGVSMLAAMLTGYSDKQRVSPV